MSPRILLVEDHSDTRNCLSRLLRHCGFEVDSVATYESATRLLSASPFKVLLSDIGLPDGNGYDLVAWAKRTQSLIAIALTAYNSRDDIERGKAAGFDYYLAKPFDFAELRRILSHVAI